MIEAVITVVVYLVIGRCIATIVDTEDILLDVLVMLFWPLVGVLAVFVFIFWM